MQDLPQIREGYVPVTGAQLYFRAIGSGPTVVVLHGGPDFNHNYLLPDLDRLSPQFQLVYYDQRGRGKSSPGVVAEDVSVESEVEDLDRVRQSLDLESLMLLGHSWGGVLALEYAARFPQRVARMVLLNTAPASNADFARFMAHREATEPNSLERMRSIVATDVYAAGDIETEAEYYRIHFGRMLPRPQDLERVVRSLRMHFSPDDIVKARAIEERLYEQTWRVPGYDLCRCLQLLRAPVLLIHGDRDFIPVACARNVACAMPGAKLVVLTECGHFSYIDRPEEAFETTTTFLQDFE